MQERVTHYHGYRQVRTGKEVVWKIILFGAVFAVLIVFFCSFLFPLFFSSNRKKCFSGLTFYYVSLANTKSQNVVDSLKNKVQSVGGGGYVLKSENQFEIVGFVYEKKEVASVILSQIDQRFDAKLIEKKMPEISKKAKRRIKSNLEFFEALNFVYCLNFELLDQVSLFFNGKITTAKMFQFLQKSKIDSQEKANNLNHDFDLKAQNEMKKVLCETLSGVEEILKNMMDEIYRSSNVSVSLKSGMILFCETHALLRENLNKIK